MGKIESIAAYEQTIRRIVEEDFRFSDSSMKGLYTLYRNYILSKKKPTATDKKYLDMYPSIMQACSRKKKEVK